MTEVSDRSGLVNAQECLERIWVDSKSRPSLRWFKQRRKEGVVPYLRLGGRFYYDPVQVRQAFQKHGGVNVEGSGK
jgi:hypothetical protein